MVLVLALFMSTAQAMVFASEGRIHWAAGHVEALYDSNVLEGADTAAQLGSPVLVDDFARWLGNVFGHYNYIAYEQSLTRLGAAILVARAFHMPTGDPSVLWGFPDYYLIPEYYRPAFAALVGAGFVRGHGTGQGVGRLDPLGILTNAQAIALIALTAGPIIFEPGVYEDLFSPANVVINVGGVTLYNADVRGNLIITGQGEPIAITGSFAHVVLDTAAHVIINGFVGQLTILADDAVVEIVDGEIGLVYVKSNNAIIFGHGQVYDIVLYCQELEISVDVMTDEEEVLLSPTPTPVIAGPTPTPWPDIETEPEQWWPPVSTPTSTPPPAHTPTPVPTPTPTPTPTPVPTPTPTPMPVLVDTILSYTNGALQFTAPDGSTVIVDPNNPPNNPLYSIIVNQLSPQGGELLVYNNEISGVILNSNTKLGDMGLTNPTTPLEVHLGQNVNLEIGGLTSDLSNLLIIGDPSKNNSVTISPSTPNDMSVSMTGTLNISIPSPMMLAGRFALNLQGNVDLTFASLDNINPIRLDLSGITETSRVSANNVIIDIDPFINDYIIGLVNMGGMPRIDFLTHRTAPASPTIIQAVLPPCSVEGFAAIHLKPGNVTLMRAQGGSLTRHPAAPPLGITFSMIPSQVTITTGGNYITL